MPLLLATRLLMVVAVFAVIPARGGAEDEVIPIDRLLAQIRTEPSMQRRSEKAKNLAELIWELPSNSRARAFDDRRIDAVAELLNDEHDGVRFWAAGAPGMIGPKAARTVPALKEAFAKIVAIRRSEGPVMLGIDSSAAIIRALERITGEEPKCPYAFECWGNSRTP